MKFLTSFCLPANPWKSFKQKKDPPFKKRKVELPQSEWRLLVPNGLFSLYLCSTQYTCKCSLLKNLICCKVSGICLPFEIFSLALFTVTFCILTLLS